MTDANATPQAELDKALDHLSRELRENTGIVTLVRGRVRGEPYWAYVQVPPDQWPALHYAQTKGSFNLKDYGAEILLEGKGKPVDISMVKDMRPDLDFSFGEKFGQMFETALAEESQIRQEGKKPLNYLGLSSKKERAENSRDRNPDGRTR